MLTYYNDYKKYSSNIKKEKDSTLTLQCGRIFDPSLPPRLNDDPNNPLMPPVKLASVTVDTRSFHKPCVNIEYSSIINLVAVGRSGDGNESITLKFRLSKNCKNRKKEILQEWIYTESDLEDLDRERESKESFTVTFCECLNCFDHDCCTYTIELIEVAPFIDQNNNPTIAYSITHKDILALISCEDHLQCGRIFDPSLPPRLNDDSNDPMMPPVKLASVTVDTKSLKKPCVNIKYSSIIDTLAAINPDDPDVDITLKFRLIRNCKNRKKEILQEWTYLQSNLEDNDGERESKDAFTVTFCDCLDCFAEDCCTYTMELIQAAPTLVNSDIGVLYNITNKNILAIVSCEKDLQCGRIFDPSLPPRLNDDTNDPMMPPIKLASVTVDTRSLKKPCINIEYSSIIHVSAANNPDNPNVEITLKFRLIRKCKNRKKEILQEWTYLKSDLQDTDTERESKDAFTIAFCECLDCFDGDCCTYTMELIQAAPSIISNNIETLYNITNKSISAIIGPKNH
ncbi:DUF4489 domain-containing protein [Anaeromicrobium sediminis]|uniref:Uncharacterized protein n=1 Tax=Anaeromicrobium sediminis TaxID=1478221 RepID=A0A267MJQ4_9FIRM|nr:DUF4489 domain-containing protein [Anaeromicrobium sediminis]PAB59013.1 hypothetical protein CCE28_12585 [Anaeromicrobium sediminis]